MVAFLSASFNLEQAIHELFLVMPVGTSVKKATRFSRAFVTNVL